MSAAQQAVDTVGERLSQLRRRQRLAGFVAGALVSEVTVFAAVKFSESSADRPIEILAALVPTVILFGGVCYAYARGIVESQADRLERVVDGGTITSATLVSDTAVPKELRDWPRGADSWYGLEFGTVLLGGALLLAFVWFSAFSDEPEEQARGGLAIIPVFLDWSPAPSPIADGDDGSSPSSPRHDDNRAPRWKRDRDARAPGR